MIRSELLTALAQDNPELRAEEVEQVVDIFFEEIAQRLAEGGRVELRGFGAFSTREREARKGRNPRTGERIQIAATNTTRRDTGNQQLRHGLSRDPAVPHIRRTGPLGKTGSRLAPDRIEHPAGHTRLHAIGHIERSARPDGQLKLYRRKIPWTQPSLAEA